MAVATTWMPVSRFACLYQEDCSRAPVPLDLSSILIIGPALHIALSLWFRCCLQSEALAWNCQIIQKPWCQWPAKVCHSALSKIWLHLVPSCNPWCRKAFLCVWSQHIMKIVFLFKWTDSASSGSQTLVCIRIEGLLKHRSGSYLQIFWCSSLG